MLTTIISTFIIIRVGELAMTYIYERYISPRIAFSKHQKQQKIRKSLERVVRNTQAVRASVLVVDNFKKKDFDKYKKKGEEILEEIINNNLMTSSVLDESYLAEIEPIKYRWQNISFDKEYFRIIHRMLVNHQITVKIGEDIRNGKLSNIFHVFDIETSAIHFILTEKKELYYLQVDYQKPVNDYDLMILTGESDYIKNILK